jgi:simple sugar transport system ATP-binding protein
VSTPIVEVRDIWKRFGAVTALAGASLAIYPGEILVILGENGAGKTSLVSVIAGLYHPDRGDILVDGRPVRFGSPRDALRYGIALVHQHPELMHNMTVRDNIVLARPRRRRWLPLLAPADDVEHLAAELGIHAALTTRVADLPVALQQRVEIGAVLYRRARLIILDEPTTFLTPQETDTLFRMLEGFAQRGMTIVLITHKLSEALRLAHRLAVMRNGQVISVVPRAEARDDVLIQQLMGGAAPGAVPAAPATSLPDGSRAEPVTVLQVDEVTTRQEGSAVALARLQFTVAAGEIVGVAGVAGNGQTELIEAVVGVRPIERGRVVVHGRDVTQASPAERLRAGLVLVPQDRLRDGIVPALRLWENLVLGLHRDVFAPWRLRPQVGRQLARDAIREFAIRAPHPDVPVSYLSGGNIQKVVLARSALAVRRRPRPVLIAANPARGLDVRATAQVHAYLRSVAQQGGGVLLLSEDLDELMALCTRILVLYRGSIAGVFTGPPYDRYQLGAAMLGQHAASVGQAGTEA